MMKQKGINKKNSKAKNAANTEAKRQQALRLKIGERKNVP